MNDDVAVDAGCTRLYQPSTVVLDDDELRH